MRSLNEALLRILSRCHELHARAQDEHGQTLAEYGLVMTLIAVAVVTLGVMAFRSALAANFSSVVNCFSGSC